MNDSGIEPTAANHEQPDRQTALQISKSRALRILGSRSLSAREVERRLLSKDESVEVAEETVKWLENLGYINDPDYAREIIRHYQAKGYGLARIKNELYRRGIPREISDDALCGLEGIEDAAIIYLEKKLKGSFDSDDLRRAENALCRRGFTYEEARTAVKRYLEETENGK